MELNLGSFNAYPGQWYFSWHRTPQFLLDSIRLSSLEGSVFAYSEFMLDLQNSQQLFYSYDGQKPWIDEAEQKFSERSLAEIEIGDLTRAKENF